MLKQFYQIQEKLDSLAKIKLDCKTEIILLKNKTVKQFIQRFFSTYNDKYATVYVETGRIQTDPQHTRSAHDLYRITKFYFPQVTYENIHIVLEEMAVKVQLVGECCGSVGEHVYSSVKARPGWALMHVRDFGDKFDEPKFHSQFVSEFNRQKLVASYKKKKKVIDFSEE